MLGQVFNLCFSSCINSIFFFLEASKAMHFFVNCDGRGPCAPVFPKRNAGVLNWFGKYVVVTPSEFNSTKQNGIIYSENSAPLGKGFGYPVKSKKYSVSFVVGLLIDSGVFAVLWRIPKIVVGSFNASIVWTLPHIGKKAFKRFKPLITDSYSPSSVIHISIIFDVIASRFHSYPYVMRFCPRHSMREIFGFKFKTSAGFGVAIDEFSGNYNGIFSTRANAIPFNSWRSCADVYCGEFAKGLAGNIEKFCHNILRWTLNRMKRAVEAGTESGVRSLNLSTAEGTL